MKKSVKFSICIPNYNYGEYIDKTIQSVLDQSYPFFEIIVVDNASTDNSVEVVKSFNDERVRLIQNQYNIGFAPNLDKATEPATGDYLILLSSDDVMKPDALSIYFRLISENNGLEEPLVICSSIDVINEHNTYMYNRFALNDVIVKGLKKENKYNDNLVMTYSGHDLLRHALPAFSIVGRFASTCYSKRLFDQIEGYRSIMSIMPDAYFSHKLMFLNPKTIVLKESLFCYRIHGTNNYSAIFQHVKLAHDAYTMTTLYSESQLKLIGIDSSILKRKFTHHWGHTMIWAHAIKGKIGYALRLWHLIWASYPNLYRVKAIAWLFPLLIPFSWALSVILYNLTFFKRKDN